MTGLARVMLRSMFMTTNASVDVAYAAYDDARLAYDAAAERRINTRSARAAARADAARHPDDDDMQACRVAAEDADDVAYHDLIVADLALRAARLSVESTAAPDDDALYAAACAARVNAQESAR